MTKPKWQHKSKTHIATKLKNLNCDKKKIKKNKIMTKLKNYKCDKTQLNFLHNLKNIFW